MATCTVSGTVTDSSGTGISSASVSFNIQTPTDTNDPVAGSTTTSSDGTWSLSLGQGLSGIFTFKAPSSSYGASVPHSFNVNIPSTGTASFSSIVVD